MADCSQVLPRVAASGERGYASRRAIALCEGLVSVLLLLAFLPLLAAACAYIFIASRRTPLIAVLRRGHEGAPLWVLKLRTMWDSAAAPSPGLVEYIVDEAGPGLKEDADLRVSSAFARLCRKFSIDELPQLLHVIRGDMSLVGPRPLTASELAAHYGTAAREVLSVKPGITGMWQTSGRNRLTYEQRRSLDLYLVRNWSWTLYVRILLRTGPVVFGGTGSW